MANLEDGLGVRIMQSPDSILSKPIIVDDPSIQVRPIKLQPPSHIVFHYLRHSERKLEWLTYIPWRIEIEIITDGVKKIIDVDTEIDVTVPTQENSFFNREEVSIHGVLFDPDQQETRSIRVQPGSTIRAYLFVGSDCIINNVDCADVKTPFDKVNPEMSYEKFLEKRAEMKRKDNEQTYYYTVNEDMRDEKAPELRRAVRWFVLIL